MVLYRQMLHKRTIKPNVSPLHDVLRNIFFFFPVHETRISKFSPVVTMKVRKTSAAAAAALSWICLTAFSLSIASADAAVHDFNNLSLKNIGLLINFSVPCDLHTDIAIPDRGGLLTPNLLAVGYQRYMFDGSQWQYAGQHATLYNKTLANVGRLYGGRNGKVTFEFYAGQQKLGTSTSKASVHAQPVISVYQMFSIPLQLLNVTGSSEISNYDSADYVQRYGTQNGLPPDNEFTARTAEFFNSAFSAFYAFYLPWTTSPQLATRVPRCGDERFYGLQRGTNPGF